jgi:AP-4 complex subunit beta-1
MAAPHQRQDVFNKKGEVNELRLLMRNKEISKDPRKKREVIKKVIAYMTLGIDVSRLFSDMVMACATTDLIVKKMVYLFLSNYAESNADLAVLAINTLTTDCRDTDPMVRGLALRSLCSLRLPTILEYVIEPLKTSLKDRSPYVRKTAVMGILKVYHLDPDLVRDAELVDTCYSMLRDNDPLVVTNCLLVLRELLAEEGGAAMNAQIVQYLLNRIGQFTEWGQCTVLDIVARYQPAVDQER